MKLIIPVMLNGFMVVLLYVLGRYAPCKKLPYWSKQVIAGVLMGGVSAFASSYGVEWMGAVVNVRDAAPLSAGLIFGAPAGVIAGVIGGMYRWVSVYWGAGTYTRLACTLATILAGVIAAGLRKLMFDDKKPTWGYGIFIAVVCEVLHMLLIFLTNMDDSSLAFSFVQGATVPMILGNAAALGIAIAAVSLISHERLLRRKGVERISQTFQRWLLICILAAYLVTSVYTYILQDGIASVETQKVFASAIKDTVLDVQGKSDEHMLAKAEQIRADYEKAPNRSMRALAREHGVTEINIVNKSGMIIDSTEEGLAGNFNMNDTVQSREFMVLTGEITQMVQPYGPVGSDEKTMRKFAGIQLQDGGFLQVGYGTEQFHDMLDDFVVDVTKNRHVGSEGFVAVCDEALNMVTHTPRNGMHISTIGIQPEQEMLEGKSASRLYETVIVNAQTDYAEEYLYVFTFVEGYCIIAAMPEAEAMFMRDASMYTSVFMQVLIFTTLFVFVYFMIKRVIINSMRKVNHSLGQITNGNLNVTVDVRTSEEFASLSDDINSTVDTLKKYIAEASARIDRELEYAKQIQTSALPANFPKNEPYDIYAQMLPAKEVGGDFYDFYRLDDRRVAFLAADVSGKGIPAAMFMMTAKTIIKDLAENGLPVDEIFTRANQRLCENNEADMFVTGWMGILDLPTGELTFANAGHNPPLLMKKEGEFTYLRSKANLALAFMEGTQYNVNTLTLEPGDRLFLYTDGVTEATDIHQQLYGEERLEGYLNENRIAPAETLLTGLKADIDSFVGEAPQFDDITMLLFTCKEES